jgi:hypothetical protein
MSHHFQCNELCLIKLEISARWISFEINLKTTDFKRNPSARTQVYEYTPTPN